MRQQVIDVPVERYQPNPLYPPCLSMRVVPMIHSLDKTMPKNFDTGVIVVSSKGGYMSKMMSRKDQDSCFRTIDHKRQHKPDHRRANVYH